MHLLWPGRLPPPPHPRRAGAMTHSPPVPESRGTPSCSALSRPSILQLSQHSLSFSALSISHSTAHAYLILHHNASARPVLDMPRGTSAVLPRHRPAAHNGGARPPSSGLSTVHTPPLAPIPSSPSFWLSFPQNQLTSVRRHDAAPDRELATLVDQAHPRLTACRTAPPVTPSSLRLYVPLPSVLTTIHPSKDLTPARCRDQPRPDARPPPPAADTPWPRPSAPRSAAGPHKPPNRAGAAASPTSRRRRERPPRRTVQPLRRRRRRAHPLPGHAAAAPSPRRHPRSTAAGWRWRAVVGVELWERCCARARLLGACEAGQPVRQPLLPRAQPLGWRVRRRAWS
jgi:hypothetical protein